MKRIKEQLNAIENLVEIGLAVGEFDPIERTFTVIINTNDVANL
jgi:hypothetical protein